MSNIPGAPQPFPCGGIGEPACAPQPAADVNENAANVLNWFHSLTPEHQELVKNWAAQA